MATSCNWNLLCPGAADQDGEAHGEDGDELVITLNEGARITVGHDESTLVLEGDLTLRKTERGNLRFVGGAAIDPTSGVTGLSGKLAFDLSKGPTFALEGTIDPQSNEVQGMATVRIRF